MHCATTKEKYVKYLPLMPLACKSVNTHFNVANEARRFVEYNSMNPCTSSSLNAFAP